MQGGRKGERERRGDEAVEEEDENKCVKAENYAIDGNGNGRNHRQLKYWGKDTADNIV